MASQKTDQLLRLIASQTKTEKRHFRLFVRRNQASDNLLFLQLFDFLDKHKQYDEDLLLRKLPGIKKRQLSNLKAHLYRQLLTSLRLLHAQHSPEMQLREFLDYARVLYDKGLYRQSLEMLERARERAWQGHFYAILLEILDLEQQLEGQYITRSVTGRAETLTAEAEWLHRTFEGAQKYAHLSLKLYSLYLKVGYARNEKDHHFVQAFFKANRPAIAFGELDFLGKVHYCHSHIWYHFIAQEFRHCYRHAFHWVRLFHREPDMIQLHASLYLKGLHNLLNALFNMWYYDRFVEVLEVLEDFPNHYPIGRERNIEGLFTMYRYTHLIKKHFIEGSYSRGLQLVPELEDLLVENPYHWDDHRIMLFYYRIACLYFGCGYFDRCIEFLNRIIQAKHPDYREDIQCFARILNLIAHFELGNGQLVEYQAKSVYRFLSKMEDLQAVQKEIFRFLRRTLRMRSGELQEAFEQLKFNLEQLEHNPLERRPFLYLDITSWLESKLAGQSVQEVVQGKFARREKRRLPAGLLNRL